MNVLVALLPKPGPKVKHYGRKLLTYIDEHQRDF